MNRQDLQGLARSRIAEARHLLQGGLYAGAYYLAGYAVECGLKACIAKKTRRYDFPDKKTVDSSYVHDLERLVGVAGLARELQLESQTSRAFEVNWATVKDWTEQSRYEQHSAQQAQDLILAITNQRNGVLRWLRSHW